MLGIYIPIMVVKYSWEFQKLRTEYRCIVKRWMGWEGGVSMFD